MSESRLNGEAVKTIADVLHNCSWEYWGSSCRNPEKVAAFILKALSVLMDCPLCENGRIRLEDFVLYNPDNLLSIKVKAGICDTCREVFLLPGQVAAMEVLRGDREFPGIPQGPRQVRAVRPN